MAGREPGASLDSRARARTCILSIVSACWAVSLGVCHLTACPEKHGGLFPRPAGAWQCMTGDLSANQQRRPVPPCAPLGWMCVWAGEQSPGLGPAPCSTSASPKCPHGDSRVPWLSPDSSRAADSFSQVLVFWLLFTHKPLSQRPK